MDKETLSVTLDRPIGLRGSLYDFVRMAWHVVEPGNEFVTNWHIPLVCERLEAFTRGDVKSLLINVPPGCMKSLLVGVFWPAWTWIRHPGFRLIGASYDLTLTRRDAGKSLGIFRSPWFQARWGDRFYLPASVAVSDYSNSAGGFRFSTSSPKGKMTGRHADAVYFDDPIKPQGVTKISLDEVENWWHTTVPSRFRNPQMRRRLGIMQRLHYRDLSAVFAAEHDVEVLSLPMEFEPKAYSVGDPRQAAGDLLWPERFSREAVRELSRDLGPMNAAAQLQQRPVPEGGAIFRLEWFKNWTVAPARFDQIVQSWDCAFKGTDGSDYVVGKVWARKGADFYALDRFKARVGFAGTCEAIRTMSRKWPKATVKLVEDKANGAAVIETLKKELSGIVAVNPEGGKEVRAHAVTGLFQAGNVYDPDPSMPGYEWVDECRAERLAFPRGTHDDEVDADTQALIYLHKKQSGWAEALSAVEKRGGRLF